MQAPTATTTTMSGGNGQYHTMRQPVSQPASSCNNCPGGHKQTQGQPQTGGQGVTSTSTVSGGSMSSLAGLFAPGDLSHDDAMLLYAGLSTIVVIAQFYLVVNRDG